MSTILKIIPSINILISSLLSVAFIIYGYFNAQTIYIKELTIHSSKILNPKRIVFFSDLHAGLIHQKFYAQKVTKIINDLSPQVILAGGDIIDSQMDGIDKNIEPLSKLNAKEKYAVIGNHEVYRGVNFSSMHLEKVGFKVLRNECVDLKDLSIAGVDDQAIKTTNENEILLKCSKNNFIILLSHRPLLKAHLKSLFDLMLSGHTHAGQLFPFTIATKLFYHGNDYGLVNFGKNKAYITAGCGTWGPPIRIFSHSEVVVVNLIPK